MRALDWLLGRPLSTHEQETEQIGPLAGIPILGLDALSSAAYGPEAALTLLLPLGALGLRYVGPISALIILILFIVYLSYRQTIAAYPGGGGSYAVAKENLGPRSALLAGAALALDYILNVAVGISAGVGALVSAVPSLLPHTLLLCLGILLVLTLPGAFAVRGRRLVFSQGIVILAVFSALLLIAFGGITDRLIPLFAIGAFLAFTVSQTGMVLHWRRAGSSSSTCRSA